MHKQIRYILFTLLMLVAFSAAGQHRRIDEQLDRYEYLCEQCMDIKSKAAISAGVSTVAFRTAAFTCGVGVRF